MVDLGRTPPVHPATVKLYSLNTLLNEVQLHLLWLLPLGRGFAYHSTDVVCTVGGGSNLGETQYIMYCVVHYVVKAGKPIML